MGAATHGGGGGAARAERSFVQRMVPLIENVRPKLAKRATLEVDEVVKELRATYPHLARQKLLTIRRLVEKAIPLVGPEGSAPSKANDASDSGSDSEASAHNSAESADSDSDAEVAAAPAVGPPRFVEVKDTNMLNASLRKAYADQAPQHAPLAGAVQLVAAAPDATADSSATRPPPPALQRAPAVEAMAAPTVPPTADAPVAAAPATPSAEKRRSDAPTPGSVSRKKRKLLERQSKGGSAGGAAGNADADGPQDGSKFEAVRPTVRYQDVGGIESVLQDVRELIEWPLMHPELYVHLGIEPVRGILLHGPPGCGKTLLANAIAGELGVPFLKISAPEIVSGMSGESEARIRDIFQEAKNLAPCIVFIDEIDAIVPKRENAQREMERRIVAQLLTSMEDASMQNTGNRPVCVIGATNRPDSIDAALRRSGRFDREIAIGIPDEAARARILRVMASKLRLAGDFDFHELARRTPGFVGADLQALTKEAAVLAVHRIFNSLEAQQLLKVTAPALTDGDAMVVDGPDVKQLSRTDATNALRAIASPLTSEQLAPLCITMDDFIAAIKQVQPSSKREGFSTVPDTTWKDIGALDSVQDELIATIVDPIRHAELYSTMGFTRPCGVLLYGPPGCGKTLLAKAIANESGANFIAVKGPELLSKFVGESERAVRQLFQRAQASAPCVIFFDELDALCPRRSDSSTSQASERVVNQLLTEMDGMEARRNVFVIAATNRPDIIDVAMLRPGRLDKLIYVGLPTASERAAILRTVARKTPIDSEVDIEQLAASPRLEGFSGADLFALVREAAVLSLRETIAAGETSLKPVKQRHFDRALQKVFPSLSAKDQREYENMRKRLQRTILEQPKPAVAPEAVPAN